VITNEYPEQSLEFVTANVHHSKIRRSKKYTHKQPIALQTQVVAGSARQITHFGYRSNLMILGKLWRAMF